MRDIPSIKGISWPFKFHNGRVVTSSGERHIEQSIRQIIGIGKGEYIMRPDLYSGINHRVFDPINVTALLAGDIREALNVHEDRILHPVNVGVDPSLQSQGKSIVSVEFVIKGKSQTTQIPNINIRTS